jgi:DNA-directed RNA polymerase II subunit RPB1
MTAQDAFIEKPRFYDLIFSGLGDSWDGRIPIPAVLYPKPLWTGKQLLGMLLPDISFNAYEPADMNDEKVCIRRGYICTGRFNKKIIGKTVERGLIHRMVHQEGHDRTADFMSHIQFVANDWMMQHSFSTGIQDCSITQEVFKKVRQKVYDVMDECSDMNMSEDKATIKLNRVRDIAAKFVLESLPSDHGMMNMIKSGSKGSNINIAQIAAAVGQQMVNGGRIPCGKMNRTSSHYTQDSVDPVGRGFVFNSYMSGLSPKEFFTHAQGGRTGLIDTAASI